MVNCKIGKITMKKSGSHVHEFPLESRNFKTVTISDWGEVTFRAYDREPTTRETLMYMLRSIEDAVLRG